MDHFACHKKVILQKSILKTTNLFVEFINVINKINGILGINGINVINSIHKINGIYRIQGINGINSINGINGIINGINNPIIWPYTSLEFNWLVEDYWKRMKTSAWISLILISFSLNLNKEMEEIFW